MSGQYVTRSAFWSAGAGSRFRFPLYHQRQLAAALDDETTKARLNSTADLRLLLPRSRSTHASKLASAKAGASSTHSKFCGRLRLHSQEVDAATAPV